MKRLKVFGTRYLRFAGLPIFLIIWQLVVWLRIVDPVLLPGPGPTFAALWHGLTTGGPLAHDFGHTVGRVLQAILIAIVIGVPVGVMLGVSEKIYQSIEFIVDFFRSTPTSALFPLFLLIFGVGDHSKVYISAFAAGLVIVFNTAYGVRNARKTRELAARSTDGLGLRVFEEQQRFDMPAMYAGIFTAGALGYGFNLILQLVEKRFVHWAGK
jgi:ABC-type nitrate/sulfonate/bicarbonate transport system permease component